ncbi:Phosphoheptose isomerase [Acidisarcina polymorpha]|uniref:Phosphoheptose isomerase n=1 Tax=Acidisarcina polymorpha TaxID=2211140 RepID=A0A2Z5FZG1_9BACT|nr:SIS domain-containing protein [Acidisarcina polymorpha]AXC11795.1 Phosphoheptose isomerase [Acidisarcina polymorpha]
MSSSEFTARYLAEAGTIAAAVDPDKIGRIVVLLREVRETGGRIFFLGAGGGAGNASHAVNDFRKIAGIESYSPSDNVSELTARINDDGWETAYANWLRGSRLNGKDVVFVFSVGGGSAEKGISVNLLNCLDLAREVGAKIIGIVGRDGGYTAAIGDEVIVIPALSADTVTPLTESFQAIIWHCIVSHPDLKLHAMKWESQG